MGTPRIDLNTAPVIFPERDEAIDYPWEELRALWNRGNFGAVHDWLNLRWSRLVKRRLQGDRDPEAQFLQGLAFAALALHFTANRNQEGAMLVLDDALVTLGRFSPAFLGVRISPVLDTLRSLRPLLTGLAPDAPCPMQPLAYNKFECQDNA